MDLTIRVNSRKLAKTEPALCPKSLVCTLRHIFFVMIVSYEFITICKDTKAISSGILDGLVAVSQ